MDWMVSAIPTRRKRKRPPEAPQLRPDLRAHDLIEMLIRERPDLQLDSVTLSQHTGRTVKAVQKILRSMYLCGGLELASTERPLIYRRKD